MYEVESSFGALGQTLLLDDFPTTIPAFSVSHALLSSNPYPSFLLRKNGGDNSTREFTIPAVGGFAAIEDSIVTWLDGNQGLMQRVYCPNTGDYFEQTTLANMPIFADAGSPSVICRDASGSPSMKFTGTQGMTMPDSFALFNKLHDGTICSQLLIAQHDGTATHGYIGQSVSNGTVGFSFLGNNFVSNSIHVFVRNNGTTVRAQALTNLIAANTRMEMFNTLDIANATTADRVVCDINGVEYKSNSATASGAIPTNNSVNIQLGIIGIYKLKGYINSFIPFDVDQRGNEASIKSYFV